MQVTPDTCTADSSMSLYLTLTLLLPVSVFPAPAWICLFIIVPLNRIGMSMVQSVLTSPSVHSNLLNSTAFSSFQISSKAFIGIKSEGPVKYVGKKRMALRTSTTK